MQRATSSPAREPRTEAAAFRSTRNPAVKRAQAAAWSKDGSEHGPPPERLAMLDLLHAPFARGGLEHRIALKDAAEITRVILAIALDEARRFDEPQNLAIDFGAVEFFPGNVRERPTHRGIIPNSRLAAKPDHGGTVSERCPNRGISSRAAHLP